MSVEKMQLDEALVAAQAAPYCLIYGYSGVCLAQMPQTMTPDEWIEAHFFWKDREIRFLRTDLALEAFQLLEREEERYIDETLKIKGVQLILRKHLLRDEDGQCYIAAIRLVPGEETQ